MQRIRITYTKTGDLRYTSNLDVQKIWERFLRRAHLPVAYSQGFHPQPRINQACPLPLGMSSRCELLDFWLKENFLVSEVKDALENSKPPGLDILFVIEVDLNLSPLQTRVLSSEYQVHLLDGVSKNELQTQINEILKMVSILRERRGKIYDLRPLIEEIHIMEGREIISQGIYMRLSAREGATGRPDEVLSALGIQVSDTSIQRIGLILENE